jgi:hypothetical protein
MAALYLTIIGVLLAGLGTVTGAWWKEKGESRGWKVSYERERERADRQDRIAERAELATDIANKFAETMQRMAAKSEKGGQ